MTAGETGAFRPARGVPEAAALLRLALAYAACGGSLRQVCAWAAATAVADLSNPALSKRLQKCPGWLGEIVGALLTPVTVPTAVPTRRLRLIDATTLCHLGARTTSWRLHVAFDLAAGRTERVELTDRHGGEGLDRVPPAPGVLDLMDAGYAAAKPIRARLAAGGDVLMRITSRSPRLCDPGTGQSFDRWAAVRAMPGPCGEGPGQVDDGDAAPLVLRLVAVRKPPQACAQARRRLRQRARDQGRTLDQKTVELADDVLLLTSLPRAEFPTAALLELYRLRWQGERMVKRWKSRLDLKALPAKTPALAQTWSLANLIAVVLIDEPVGALRTRFPPQRGEDGAAVSGAQLPVLCPPAAHHHSWEANLAVCG